MGISGNSDVFLGEGYQTVDLRLAHALRLTMLLFTVTKRELNAQPQSGEIKINYTDIFKNRL